MLYEYRAGLSRIVDGDTMDVIVDLGLRVHRKIRIRLRGVDTPEVYGVKKGSKEYEAGVAASLFTVNWFDERVGPVLIRTYKAPGDKYGRWLAEVHRTLEDGKYDPISLNVALREADHHWATIKVIDSGVDWWDYLEACFATDKTNNVPTELMPFTQSNGDNKIRLPYSRAKKIMTWAENAPGWRPDNPELALQ